MEAVPAPRWSNRKIGFMVAAITVAAAIPLSLAATKLASSSDITTIKLGQVGVSGELEIRVVSVTCGIAWLGPGDRTSWAKGQFCKVDIRFLNQLRRNRSTWFKAGGVTVYTNAGVRLHGRVIAFGRAQ